MAVYRHIILHDVRLKNNTKLLTTIHTVDHKTHILRSYWKIMGWLRLEEMPGFWGWSNPSPKQGQSWMTNKGNFTTSFRNLFRNLTILFLYLIRISFITISAYCFLPPYTPVRSQGFDSISDVNSHCIVVENKMPPPYTSHPSLLFLRLNKLSFLCLLLQEMCSTLLINLVVLCWT